MSYRSQLQHCSGRQLVSYCAGARPLIYLQLRGYGGEAALRYVDFLFRNFPLRRITTEIYEFATATLGIVRAMGAEEAGFIPEHFWHEDRYWGVHLMVLTRENWNRYRDRFVDVIDVQQGFAETEVPDRPAARQVGEGGHRGRANGTSDFEEVSREHVDG